MESSDTTSLSNRSIGSLYSSKRDIENISVHSHGDTVLQQKYILGKFEASNLLSVSLFLVKRQKELGD
jgi:hypothetical protein